MVLHEMLKGYITENMHTR